jgi:hypothetical protein
VSRLKGVEETGKPVIEHHFAKPREKGRKGPLKQRASQTRFRT